MVVPKKISNKYTEQKTKRKSKWYTKNQLKMKE